MKVNLNPNDNNKKNKNDEIDNDSSDSSNLKSEDDLERNKKLRILEKIDNKRIIQNNHYMIGEYNDATKIAKEIIILAREAKLQSIIEEQEDLIKQIKLKILEKKKISKIKDSFRILKINYEKLMKNDNIVEAHNIVEQFKQKFDNISILKSIPEIKKLLSQEGELWIKSMEQQDKIKKKLKSLDNQFHRFLNKNDIENSNETFKKAKKILTEIFEEEYKIKWETYEKEFQDHKRKIELIDKIGKSIKEGLKLTQKFSFNEALSKIDSIMELIQGEDLSDYEDKLMKTRKEILAAEIKYKKLYLEFAEWKSKIRLNQEKEFLNAAIWNCECIIPISQEIGMHEEEKKYKELLEQLKKEIKENEYAALKEHDKFIENVKEYESLIKIDEDTLPLIEEFTVKALLGNLSDDIQEKLEQVGSLLNEYRVEVKKEITSRAIFTTTSGEIIEREDMMEVRKIEEKVESEYYVHSSLKNRLDDTIKDAVLINLIPYNFEISEIKYNEEPVQELPEKNLKKDGVELKWKIGNLAPKKRIEISYNLRRRVSRTIILILNGQMKIIKTHSNINKLQLEGLYEAKLPFTNLLGLEIDAVIIEDIIPLSFLHFIEEPKNLLPDITTNLEIGKIFKWNVGTMKDGTLNYHYKFLEASCFEEIKININELNKEGLQDLNKGNLIGALAKYKEIRNLLLNNIR
jgi:hypothetical protein